MGAGRKATASARLTIVGKRSGHGSPTSVISSRIPDPEASRAKYRQPPRLETRNLAEPRNTKTRTHSPSVSFVCSRVIPVASVPLPRSYSARMAVSGSTRVAPAGGDVTGEQGPRRAAAVEKRDEPSPDPWASTP